MSLFDHIKKPKTSETTSTPSFANMGKPAEPPTATQSAETVEIPTPVSVEPVAPVVAETRTPADDNATDQRFFVGIDLGTTHCVLSYAEASDDEDAEFSQQVMAIPQLTSLGMVEDKNQLPSFLYQAHEAEIAEGSTALPWTSKPEHLV
ncbi:MAG: Hsp70 family protein, partial [Methylococcaceae bacterium]|nr:Hsp70 family protein [Methylococcaceae bacterium]